MDIGLIDLGGVLPQIKGGKLRALAVSTPSRLPELPESPTAAKAGVGALTSARQGLFVPAATPKPVLHRLHAALNAALAEPEVREALGKLATIFTPSKSPEETQFRMAVGAARWAKIITESGVRPE